MLLIDLPEEVLLLVLEKCTAQNLTALAQTCTGFAKFIQLDVVWKKLCKKDYNIEELGSIDNYYCLYSRILHHHGWMLGLFQCQTNYNGGLLEVSYSSGMIQGIQWSTPLGSLNDPLVKTIMFQISEAGKDPNCIKEACSCHNAEISKIDDGQFVYTCKNRSSHSEINPTSHQNHEDIFKGITYKRLYISDIVENQEVLIHGSTSPGIITPGFFVAECNVRGREIVMFRCNDTDEIHGLKVAGDGNVMSGKLTMKFDMRYPVTPSLEQQRSMQTLSDIIVLQSDMTVKPKREQRFIVPHRCFQFDRNIELPEMCKARYFGYGKVISEGYENPTYTHAHLVIFSTDLLGVLWLDLALFIVYRRKELD